MSYRLVHSRFWSGRTGKELRGDHLEQAAALYIMSCRASNSIGLFYLPLPLMAHELGCSVPKVRSAISRLEKIEFCSYDEASEWIFVHRMAAYQIGDQLKPNDKRQKGILRALEEAPEPLFVSKFLELYGESYGIAPSKGLRRGIQGASKPLRSKEKEKEKEKEIDTESPNGDSSEVDEDPPPEPVEVVAEFETVGKTKTWTLDRDEFDRYATAFPDLDISAEIRKAGAWLESNPKRRKTAAGMSRFLYGWLERTQNGRGATRAQSTRAPALPPGFGDDCFGQVRR